MMFDIAALNAKELKPYADWAKTQYPGRKIIRVLGRKCSQQERAVLESHPELIEAIVMALISSLHDADLYIKSAFYLTDIYNHFLDHPPGMPSPSGNTKGEVQSPVQIVVFLDKDFADEEDD